MRQLLAPVLTRKRVEHLDDLLHKLALVGARVLRIAQKVRNGHLAVAQEQRQAR